MMLHPGRVVEHQSASSCRAGRCVVVRRTRCRVPSVEKSCPYVLFCVLSQAALVISNACISHNWDLSENV